MTENISFPRCFLMSLKGQKSNKYTEDYKKNYRKISKKEYRISKFAILTWIKKDVHGLIIVIKDSNIHLMSHS